MEKYNYLDSMVHDIKEYLKYELDITRFDSADDLKDFLNDELWCDDSVTGNASGSYWFSTWKAEEAVCHNYDLMIEAMEEFGSVVPKSAEDADVLIRCYYLNEAVDKAVDEFVEANDLFQDEE